MIIQLTKKLADEMKMNVSKTDFTNENQLFCWHANIFKMGRKKCVIVMNNVTRYNFMLYGLVKKDFTNFEELVKENIKTNLLCDEIDLEIVESYMSKLGDVQYSSTSDRSILSQMNDMIFMIDHYFYHETERGNAISLYDLNRKLNDTIMTKLPLYYPYKMMKTELHEFYHRINHKS